MLKSLSALIPLVSHSIRIQGILAGFADIQRGLAYQVFPPGLLSLFQEIDNKNSDKHVEMRILCDDLDDYLIHDRDEGLRISRFPAFGSCCDQCVSVGSGK